MNKKKIASFLLAMYLACFFVIPINAATVSADDNQVTNTYDGMRYSGDVTIEQLENLSPALKDILKEDDGVILSIQDNRALSSEIHSRASSEATGTLVVRRTSNPNYVEFLLTVTRTGSTITSTFEDKIALSWAGNCALVTDSCGIQTRPGGPFENIKNSRAEVSPNQGVSYNIHPNGVETSFLLRATVDNRNSGTQSKNVVGGYARKTFGLTGITTNFGAGSISFSASAGTYWKEMSPVYTRFI